MSSVEYMGLELGKIWAREICPGVLSDSSRACLYILQLHLLHQPSLLQLPLVSPPIHFQLGFHRSNLRMHFPDFSHVPLVYCLRPTYMQPRSVRVNFYEATLVKRGIEADE